MEIGERFLNKQAYIPKSAQKCNSSRCDTYATSKHITMNGTQDDSQDGFIYVVNKPIMENSFREQNYSQHMLFKRNAPYGPTKESPEETSD